jgi:hypothetical protein
VGGYSRTVTYILGLISKITGVPPAETMIVMVILILQLIGEAALSDVAGPAILPRA